MVLLSKTAFAGIQQKQSWGCAPLFSTHVRWCEHGLDKEKGFSDPGESLEVWDRETPGSGEAL